MKNCVKIPYAKLASVFEAIENESSRLAIIAIISQFFGSFTTTDN